MYRLAGEPVEPLGPGSKEKRSALEALGRAVGLDLANVRTKVACGDRIAARLDLSWDSACYSGGDSITLTGMNRLLDGYDVKFPDRAGTKESERREVTVEETDVQSRIVEAIADLSGTDSAPAGFAEDRSIVEADEIEFADGGWRTQLAQVAEWLHLDDDLDEASTDAFDNSLAIELGLGSNWRDGLTDPVNDSLLPRLAERLDRALELRDEFLAEVEKVDEGSATVESATAVWAARWDEVGEDEEVAGSGTIHAEAGTLPITEFIEQAENGELNLSPSFQRADVWPTTTSQQLIESILRGIPLPSIITLDKADPESGTTSYDVVDGKQRLTSILRFTGKHPVAIEIVEAKAAEWAQPNLLTTFQNDYPAFKRIWKKNSPDRLTAQVERSLYFPFPLRSGDMVKPLSGQLEPLRGRYYCQIRDVAIPVQGVPRKVRTLFESSSTSYKLPVITYKQVSPEQIHEVFSLYNKQGKHLNAEEIRNALYHHLDFMKALVVTAGDSGTAQGDAAFLLPEWGDLSSTQAVLNSYGFARAGYKRTKLLSWICATLLLEDGALPGRSTTNHINALLKRVSDNPKDALRREEGLLKAMILLDKGLDVHAAIGQEIWAKKFINPRSTGKWQELQLVATLIALSAAHTVHGEDLVDVLEARFDEVQIASTTWERPKKTQSKEQWVFIATVVGELLALLDVAPEVVDEKLRADFGASGLSDLLAVRHQ
ncbi:MAG: DUF262 domain-containing protein [Actinobacteria bacterium]|nr:DUF262 domain-containing protein [Actinomycetota bacterium]